MTLRLAPLLLALALGLSGLTGCTEPDDPAVSPLEAPAESGYASYGEPIALGDGTVALRPAALTADPATYDGTVVRVEGTVAEVCRMEGCWLTLENPTATPIRVVVPRDADGRYLFTFPTDAGMLDVIVEGTVDVDTMSVEELRHYAEDEGRAQEEIDAITEPQPTVVLTATGALVEADAATEPEHAEGEPAAEPAAQS